MIDIDKLEDDIKSIVDTDSIEEVTDFVLSPIKDNYQIKNVEDENSQILNEPIQIQSQPDNISHSDKFEEDFNYVRNNLKDIIAQGGTALQQAMAIAQSAESPRSYEILAILMKSLADINKDLLSTHKQKDERTVNTSSTQQTNIQNNTVFVGSTAEFSKLMKEKLKK